jgi:hypothetical protein
MSEYRCKHCRKVVERDSDKMWIKSLCEETGKIVHLIKSKLESEGK